MIPCLQATEYGGKRIFTGEKGPTKRGLRRRGTLKDVQKWWTDHPEYNMWLDGGVYSSLLTESRFPLGKFSEFNMNNPSVYVYVGWKAVKAFDYRQAWGGVNNVM